MWVEQELIALRPDFYSVALAGWLQSNRTEDSWLLRGPILQAAQQWAADKSLSDDDYRFLTASRQLAQQEVQRQLDLEAEAAGILAEANQALVAANDTMARANHQARRQIYIGGGILACSLVGAVVLGGWAALLAHEAHIERINSLTISAAASRQDHQELDSLIKAVKAEKYLQSARYSDAKTQQSVRITLQRSLWQISEHNRLLGHEGKVRRVQFSPDGQQLATAGDDGTVRLWHRSGQLLQKWGNGQNPFLSVRFSPDGRTLAAIDSRHNLVLWETTGREIRRSGGDGSDEHFMADLCFINDGQQVVTPASKHRVKIWDVATGATRAVLTGNTHTWAMACSDRLKTIITGDQSGNVTLWDFQGRKIRSFAASQQSIFGLALSPDGTSIATATGDPTLKRWSLLGQPLQTINAHTSHLLSVTFSANGQQMVTTSADRTVKLWDVATGKEQRSFRGHREEVFGSSFSPDGRTLATAAGDETVKLWDLAHQEQQSRKGHSASLWAIAFQPQAPYFLASAGDDKTIRIWNAAGRGVRTIAASSPNDWNRIWSLKFSPDGQMMATGNADRSVQLITLGDGHIKTLTGHRDNVTDISFHPQGQTLVTASFDGSLRRWNTQGQLLQTITENSNKIRGVAFNPTGTIMASAHEDGSIHLWDGTTGRSIGHQSAHRRYINKVSFSPDGSYLASASADKTLRLWQVGTNHSLSLSGHTAEVTQVSFHPNGQQLASASADGTVRIWDTRSGQELQTLQGSNYPLWNLAYHPNGQTLAAVDDQGLVYVWDAEVSDIKTLTARACSWLGDYLQSNTSLSNIVGAASRSRNVPQEREASPGENQQLCPSQPAGQKSS
jgi:WD40 repeat protein